MSARNKAELVLWLAALAEEYFLATVVVTATMDAQGRLGRVEGVGAKLDALLRERSYPVASVCGLCDNQTDILASSANLKHRDGSARVQLIDAGDLAGLITQLRVRQQVRKGVKAINYQEVLKADYATFVQQDDWLLRKVEGILGNPQEEDPCPYRVLATGPGVGKTAFSLSLVRRHRQTPLGNWILGAWHALRRAHPEWNRPEDLVGQLELRLRRNLGCSLNPSERNSKVTPRNAAVVLSQAIREASESAEELGKGLLILIDGLDEVFGQSAGQGSQRELLLELFPRKPEFPSNVRILFTSRPGPHLNDWLGQLGDDRTISGTAVAGRIDQDIRAYLEREVSLSSAHSGIPDDRMKELIQQMVTASQGIFLVARYFASEVQTRERLDAWVREIAPESLPVGIEGMMDAEWGSKIAQLHARSESKLALFKVIVAALAIWDQEGIPGDWETVEVLLVEAGEARAAHSADGPPAYVGELPRNVLAKQNWVRQILRMLVDWFESDKTYTFRHTRISEVLLQPQMNLIDKDTLTQLHRLLAWRGQQWPKMKTGSNAHRHALALCAWHGTMSDDQRGLDLACVLLLDKTYLRDIYATFGNSGANHLERALLVIWRRHDGIDKVFQILSKQEELWPRASGAGHAIRFVGRHFINLFSEKSDSEIRSLQPREIEEFVRYCMRIYETEPLSDALKTLAKAFRVEREPTSAVWDNVRKLILDSPDFVAKYGLAEAEAEAGPNEGPLAIRLEQFKEWLESEDPSYQELAGYALRFLFAKRDSSIDVDALHRMSNSESYLVRSSLGDLLINLQLQDRWPKELEWTKLDKAFLSPRFEFNYLDILDILSLRVEPGLDCQPTTTATREFHHELRLHNDRLKSHPDLKDLAHDYFELGVDPHELKEKHRAKIWKVCATDPTAFEFVFRHLLRHPLWECSEAAASLLADYVSQGSSGQRNGAKAFLRSILGKKDVHYTQDWRLHAGAIETAFALRNSDPSLFDDAVQSFSGAQNNPRVRGLVAENVVAAIVEELDSEERGKLIKKWISSLKGWLQDTDAWVLEHMYRLFRELVSKDPLIQQLLTEPSLSPLLVGSGTSKGQEWQRDFWKLNRKQYLMRIEANAARLPCK